MAEYWISGPAPFDPPELIGGWTGKYTVLTNPGTDQVILVLDVYYPVPFLADPAWIRAFHRKTRDECLEAFGSWIDAMQECDSIE